jgi:polyisoprenoid-binding protein YceI
MNLSSATKPIVWISFLLTLSSFLEEPAIDKFNVDSKASTVTWVGKKVTGQHTGTIQIESGSVIAEGKNIINGNFDIDLTSLTVTDIADKASNQKLVGHLKSDDFFGVEKFPKANFVITKVSHKVGSEYVIDGKLTIKGITNDIQFPAAVIRDGKKLTATAKIIVDRTKYDIKFRSTSFFENLGDKAIYDDFELNLKLVAVQQSGV